MKKVLTSQYPFFCVYQEIVVLGLDTSLFFVNVGVTFNCTHSSHIHCSYLFVCYEADLRKSKTIKGTYLQHAASPLEKEKNVDRKVIKEKPIRFVTDVPLLTDRSVGFLVLPLLNSSCCRKYKRKGKAFLEYQ